MRLGTRGSDLALWQAEHIAHRLRGAGHEVEIVVFQTRGDRLLDRPLAEIGGKGLFTDELDKALVSGDIQLAVHSLKDLPTELPDELVLAAVTSREEPWDAFVAHTAYGGQLADLPQGAVIATSSLRRRAQLLAWRPDLEIVPVRGNVPTRIEKLDKSGPLDDGGWHGLILATAGLVRLGLENRVTERIGAEVMLPAVGQGALAVVSGANDKQTLSICRDVLGDPGVVIQITAERALLRRLEGGCQVPVAAHATLEGDHVRLDACVVALDGSAVVSNSHSGPVGRAAEIGVALAEHLLDRGADEILAAVRAATS